MNDVFHQHVESENDNNPKDHRNVSVDGDDTGTNLPTNNVLDVWASIIPQEILLKIVHMARKSSDAPVLLLCRLSQVCTRWYNICGDPSLWDTVDLSCGWINRDVKGMTRLCEARLTLARRVIITAWYNLTDQHLHNVAVYFSNLSSLTISHCDHLTNAGITCLAEHGHCPNLTSLTLTNLPPRATPEKTLSHLVCQLGPQLLKLDLSGNHMGRHFFTLFGNITKNCSKLQELVLRDKQDWDAEMLDLIKLQRGCSSLRHLHLTGSKFYYPPTLLGYPGFLNLETFSGPLGMTTDFLHRVTRTAFKLEELNMEDAAVLGEPLHIPATALRRLRIQQDVTDFRWCEQWQHSLVELNLSWTRMKGHEIDATLNFLFNHRPARFQKLECLNLSGTSVSFRGVRSPLMNCPQLKVLNLTCCQKLDAVWRVVLARDSLHQSKQQIA